MQQTVTTPRARDYMKTQVHTVGPRTGLSDAVSLLLEHRISSVPVVEDRDGRPMLVGYLSEHDCLQALANELFYGNPAPFRTVGTVMRRHPVCAGPDTELFALTSILVSHRLRHLPIVENGELRGIVSRRDVLGAIEHEYDELMRSAEKRFHPPDLQALANMRFIVS